MRVYKALNAFLTPPLYGDFLVYCSKCGEELPENAYFCPRCGLKTKKGVEAGISTVTEDLRDAFYRMGEEIEKTFSIAGREIERAFRSAREKIRESTSRESVSCPSCQENNPAHVRFCRKCGKKLN